MKPSVYALYRPVGRMVGNPWLAQRVPNQQSVDLQAPTSLEWKNLDSNLRTISHLTGAANPLFTEKDSGQVLPDQGQRRVSLGPRFYHGS